MGISNQKRNPPKSSLLIFCSWSQCEKDRELFEALRKHLTQLTDVEFWHKGRILAGADYAKEVEQHERNAHLILLLLSVDFLNSKACEQEVERAVEQTNACVIPVILHSCTYWLDGREGVYAGRQCLPENGKPMDLWPNQDQVLTQVTISIQKVAKRLLRQMPPPVSQFPAEPNSNFTGEEVLLEQLYTSLKIQHQVLRGPVGIGKTQLALAYAYRHRQEYRQVLWTQAQTREELTASFIEIARYLQLPQQYLQEQKAIIEAVKYWLETWSGWLLILDNVSDINLLHDFLPSFFTGRLLLTITPELTSAMVHLPRPGMTNDLLEIRSGGKNQQGVEFTAVEAEIIDIKALDNETGAELLLRYAGLIESQQTLVHVKTGDHALAREISSDLQGIPLALSLAGAYIKQASSRLSSYRRLYQKARTNQTYLTHKPGKDIPEPIMLAWFLSFEKIQLTYPMAAALLQLCTFVAPNTIPIELLENALTFSHPVTVTVEKKRRMGLWLTRFRALIRKKSTRPDWEVGQQDFEKILKTLRDYALIALYRPAKVLTVHQLIQEATRSTMSDSLWLQLAQAMILAFGNLYPECLDFTRWSVMRQLPHLFICAEQITNLKLVTPQAVHLLSQTGHYLHEHQRGAEIQRFYESALKMSEQLWGGFHPDVAAALNNLAGLYLEQGHRDLADKLYQRSLQIREEILGTQHIRTATSLHNLARLHESGKKYHEAEQHYQRALSIRESQLGPQHPYTATSRATLIKLYEDQGKLNEANDLQYHVKN